MKEDLKYSALWQNKRNEWTVDTNQDTDWMAMKSLLDEQLPAPPPAGGPGGSNTGTGNGLIKLLAILAITVPLAVLLYFLMTNGALKTQKQPVNQHDSLAISSAPGSTAAMRLAIKDSIIAYDDSINIVQQQVITAGSALNNLLADGDNTSDRRDSVAAIKQQLATANNLLAKLVTARNIIAQKDKSAGGKSTKTYSVASPSMPSSTQANVSINDKAATAGKSTNNNIVSSKTINRHGVKNSGVNAGSSGNMVNPSGYSSGGGNNPINTNSNAANNRTGTNSNYIPGNNTAITQRIDVTDLSVINGYHPDADVFGSIAAPGSFAFKNNLRPGDMRYKGRVFATGGNSKITVNKPEKPKKEKKIKEPKNPGDTVAYFDWGLLAGVNTNGSFTGKSQNANIYGSLPVDAYTGLFGTYHFNSRFGVQAQTWLLNPLKFSGGYSHANGSKVEKGAIIQVTDSRKVYFITIPVNFMYRVAGGFNIKGGPVISLPVKQVNGVTSLTPTVINRDTVYYRTVTGQLNATKYDTKPNIGLSGGIQLQTGRLWFDATYQKSLRGYNVVSEYGTYGNNPGVLQFTIGFKLGGGK